jgi:hypothetical protein
MPTLATTTTITAQTDSDHAIDTTQSPKETATTKEKAVTRKAEHQCQRMTVFVASLCNLLFTVVFILMLGRLSTNSERIALGIYILLANIVLQLFFLVTRWVTSTAWLLVVLILDFAQLVMMVSVLYVHFLGDDRVDNGKIDNIQTGAVYLAVIIYLLMDVIAFLTLAHLVVKTARK